MKVISSFRGPYSFLSNFYLTPVEYEGEIYPSAEHAYQAAKGTLADNSYRERIKRARSPGDAKSEGRRLRNLREGWDEIKLTVMRDVIWSKFRDPALKAKLLATGDAELIEGNNWNDHFWGVCNGLGENHLGRILMKIRKELR